MNAQLNYMMVQHRGAELRHAGKRARLVTELPARGGTLRGRNTITRPSPEPWQGSVALEAEHAVGGAK